MLKNIIVLSVGVFISACSINKEALKQASQDYSLDNHRANKLVAECYDHNKNKVTVPQANGAKDIKIEFAAQGCEDLKKGIRHAGDILAVEVQSKNKLAGDLAGIAIGKGFDYAINENSNDTRVKLRELEVEENKSRDELTSQIITQYSEFAEQALQSSNEEELVDDDSVDEESTPTLQGATNVAN